MVITGLGGLAQTEKQARGKQDRKGRGSGIHGIGSVDC